MTFTPSDATDFTTATGSTSVTVNRATPRIAWATPAAVSYGTGLSTAQLNATASYNGLPVTGTFIYSPAAGAVLPSGSQTLGVIFTPADAADFNNATGSTPLSVTGGSLSISWPTPAPIAYGTALSAAQLNATATSNGVTVAGTFTYSPVAGTVLAAGSQTLGVTFTPNDAVDYSVTRASNSVTVNSVAPVITWAPPSAILYGTALSATQLNATATYNGVAVAGTFTYSPAAGTVLAAGSQTLSVSFTPTDSTDFATVAGSTSLTVNQAPLSLSWSTPTAITYGTALSGTQLNASVTFNGAPVAGTFTYSPAAGAFLTAGPQTLNVTFTPNDATDFATASGSTSLTVNPATFSVTWPTPAPIVYGTALSGSQLNASATFNGVPIAGTFTYAPAAGAVLTAGFQNLAVTFTPADATDFSTATGSTSLTINPATPVIAWTTPGGDRLRTALSATQLNATATYNGVSVPGTFTYAPAAGAVLTAGSQSLTVTFTPTDTTDFATVTSSASLTVNPATPVIAWPTPAAIPYGTALSATQFNATASYNGVSVPGTFAYSPAVGTVFTAGTQTLGVTFTPADAVDYNTVTGSTSLTITQAVYSITWSSPPAITYGTTLTSAQLNATATYNGSPVSGMFTYSPAAGTLLTAGFQTLNITFNPTDTVDYITATGSTSLTVNPVVPALTWAAPAAITYGTALSGTQLNATATYNGVAVPGTFSYSPGLGTVLAAGAQTLNVTFTPTDTVDYVTVSGTASLTVNKAPVSIAWSAPTAITYGTALSATQLNSSASFNGSPVAGTFAYSPALGTVLTAGSKTLNVTFTPTDTTDYTTATGSTSLTVNPGTLSVAWSTPTPIVYGTALSGSQLNASATLSGVPIPGTLTYSPAAGTVLPAGLQTLNVTFNPTDSVDYSAATGSTTLTVSSATPVLTWTAPQAIGYGAVLSATQLNASATSNGVPVPGTFTYSPVAGTALTAGTQSLSVTFAPTDATDFKTVTGSTSLTVNRATPVIGWATPAAIPYGTVLSATQLNASATYNGSSVPGAFTYTPAAGSLLNAGSQSLAVSFTPADTTDFNAATGSTSLRVINTSVTLTWTPPTAITYGTALSAAQLNASATFNGAPVAGTFTYSPAAGTVLAAGTQTLSVTFTPTDSTNFGTISGTTSLVVNQAPVSLSWSTPAAITYGAALSATQLNATATYNGATIPGTFTYSPAAARF